MLKISDLRIPVPDQNERVDLPVLVGLGGFQQVLRLFLGQIDDAAIVLLEFVDTCIPAVRLSSAWSRPRGEGLSRNQRNNPMQLPAPGIEMPRPNPERSTVPSASNAERPVPTARGNVAGRPEG
jgi:hypothetical protein